MLQQSNSTITSIYPMGNQTEELTALYCRLSQDDKQEGDSNSIINQKKILKRYAIEHGYQPYVFFVDDGFSGTNFNRPDFQRMIAEVEAGRIKRVIVKDMSRLGRDYLQVGMYTEIMFPNMDVHFIAVNDGVDSHVGDNEFTPFRNIINEWYAKDTSKKVRAYMLAKGQSGKSLNALPIYGYKYADDGSKQWVIDPDAAEVVYQIGMDVLNGFGPNRIAARLEQARILAPNAYFASKGMSYHGKDAVDSYHWSSATVARMMDHYLEYSGHTVNFRTHRKSYKIKKKVNNPPEQWMVFEDTHEAIWTEEMANEAKRARESRRRVTRLGDTGIFSGLVYCADCGQKLYLGRSVKWEYRQENYTCSTYRSRKGCSAHYIRTVVLEQLVLENLQKVISFAQFNEEAFVEMLMDGRKKALDAKQASVKRTLAKQERRITELDTIIQKLYEDNVCGKLTDERFAKLSAGYEQEQAELTASVQTLRKELAAAQESTGNAEKFLRLVRKYTEPKELTTVMVHELIDKIIVHAPDKSSGERIQQIDIRYNFIGEVEFSAEYATRTTA